jgi:hypothetical protein
MRGLDEASEIVRREMFSLVALWFSRPIGGQAFSWVSFPLLPYELYRPMNNLAPRRLRRCQVIFHRLVQVRTRVSSVSRDTGAKRKLRCERKNETSVRGWRA